MRFRLQHYKRYEDTGWIDVGQLTAFVGKNEAGKSALFQGLAKLNPSDGSKYDEFRELPRRLLTKLRGKNCTVCSAVFKLNTEEVKHAKKLYRNFQCETIGITKNYNNEISVFYPENNKCVSKALLNYIKTNMPQFLYFDNYDVLESAINIPDYLSKLSNNPTNRKLRVQNCLFKHVGLNPNELQRLDPTGEDTHVDGHMLTEQRSALCNSAQVMMTKKFSEWWFQRRHKFHYKIDADFFHIEISDDIDSSPIVLEERSMGMRYFFSFYLIFLVEAESTHKNSIILLDEPGLHYHGSMQIELIRFFKELSKKNQILYSTHSPFLVDSTNLDSIKTVFEDTKTGFSRVAEAQNWPRDQEALFPIRVGWWYDVLTSYITPKIHLILEGQSDVEIFNTMNRILEKMGKESLISDVLCVPGGGHKTTHLVSLLKASNVRIILFQDGDDVGISRSRALRQQHNIPYATTKEFCSISNSTIEDLFSKEFYLNAVKKAYPDLPIDDHYATSDAPIINLLKKNHPDLDLDKMKVTTCLVGHIDDVSEDSINIFEKIFCTINELAKRHYA